MQQQEPRKRDETAIRHEECTFDELMETIERIISVFLRYCRNN